MTKYDKDSHKINNTLHVQMSKRNKDLPFYGVNMTCVLGILSCSPQTLPKYVAFNFTMSHERCPNIQQKTSGEDLSNIQFSIHRDGGYHCTTY